MNTENTMLRLAVGSHEAGSGMGCAMNVQSWINGDKVITDFPDCADPVLSAVVQRVNDTYCTHRNSRLLCADCSVEVLDLSNKTVGTRLKNRLVMKTYNSVALRMGLPLAPNPQGIENSKFALKFGPMPFYFHQSYALWLEAQFGALKGIGFKIEKNGWFEQVPVYEKSGAEVRRIRMGNAHKLLDTFREVAGVDTPAPETKQIDEAVEKMAVVA